MYLVPIFTSKNYVALPNEDYMEYFKSKKINHVFFNKIDSKYQSEYLSRLLIFSHDNLQESLEIQNNFFNLF